jgi:hypothetical protein
MPMYDDRSQTVTMWSHVVAQPGLYRAVADAVEAAIASYPWREYPPVLADWSRQLHTGQPTTVAAYLLPESVRPMLKPGRTMLAATVYPDDTVGDFRPETPRETLERLGI